MPPAKRARKATTATKRRNGPRTMTAAHKKALARGREMSAIVDRYLASVNVPKKRGRKVSVATLRKRLAVAQETVKASSGVAKVLAAQAVRDLRRRIAEAESGGRGEDVKVLEASFVKVAKQFATNRDISYGAWRDAGVPAVVLQRAGIARTRG